LFVVFVVEDGSGGVVLVVWSRGGCGGSIFDVRFCGSDVEGVAVIIVAVDEGGGGDGSSFGGWWLC
jgi:hypothetical protein